MAEPLTFQALASSDYVLSSAENYILYVLLEAIAQGVAGAGGGTRLPLNLGVVIDRSGSMYDERRLEFVIDAVKFLSNNVAGDDRVALVAFADRAKVILDSNQIHDKGAVQRALDDIDLLEIGGGTQMALGMQAAIDEVNKGHAPNRLNRVLVLTDGQTYQETACTELATKYREAMSFSTMGVGVEFNEKLLQKIAQDSTASFSTTEARFVSRSISKIYHGGTAGRAIASMQIKIVFAMIAICVFWRMSCARKRGICCGPVSHLLWGKMCHVNLPIYV